MGTRSPPSHSITPGSKTGWLDPSCWSAHPKKFEARTGLELPPLPGFEFVLAFMREDRQLTVEPEMLAKSVGCLGVKSRLY
jgi:hypothetical protein